MFVVAIIIFIFGSRFAIIELRTYQVKLKLELPDIKCVPERIDIINAA